MGLRLGLMYISFRIIPVNFRWPKGCSAGSLDWIFQGRNIGCYGTHTWQKGDFADGLSPIELVQGNSYVHV